MIADASPLSPHTRELLFALLAWGCMIPVAGAVCVGVWRFTRPRPRVWPAQRQRLVTWTLMEFALALLLAHYMLPILVVALLYPWVPEPVRNGAATPEAKAELARLLLYTAIIAAPFQILLITGILRLQAKAPPLQTGLSLHRWRADLAAGFLGWLFVTPVCYFVFWIVLSPALEEQIGPVSPHVVKHLIDQGPTPWEWLLLVTVTVLAAPVVEELLLRGLLQPLMVKHPLLADALMITALLGAIGLGLYRGQSDASPLLPILFLVAAGAGYLLFEWLMQPWLPRPGAARAIYATSVVFAAMHYEAWPSPVPIFILSLGLGYVSYRTQSLWGAIVMHALFNLVNYVAFGLMHLAG